MRTRPATAVGGLVLALVLSSCGFGGSESATSTLPPLESTEWKTIPTTSTTLSPNAGAGGVPAAPTGEQSYTIAPGDYPLKVAGLFGCDWEVIAGYNELDPEKFPFPSSQILIPATCGVEETTTTVAGAEAQPADSTPANTTTTAADLPAGQAEYPIVAGDTLSGIASKFDTTMQAIVDLNGWEDGINHVLIPGNKIKVPVAG